MADGRDVTRYTLTNANGMVVKIINLGGAITEIHVPDRIGTLADVNCGYDDVAAYMGESHYFGALIGRYGNRIANARFTLDGETVALDVNNGAITCTAGPTASTVACGPAKPSPPRIRPA